MSRANLTESINAVEQALEHFAGSLERGGFQAGAPAYRQMATLMVGQRIWALGSIIIWRSRRFHISATYVISFIGFAFLRSSDSPSIFAFSSR